MLFGSFFKFSNMITYPKTNLTFKIFGISQRVCILYSHKNEQRKSGEPLHFFKMNYSSSSFFFLVANNPALAAASIDATLIVPLTPVFTFLLAVLLPSFELESF